LNKLIFILGYTIDIPKFQTYLTCRMIRTIGERKMWWIMEWTIYLSICLSGYIYIPIEDSLISYQKQRHAIVCLDVRFFSPGSSAGKNTKLLFHLDMWFSSVNWQKSIYEHSGSLEKKKKKTADTKLRSFHMVPTYFRTVVVLVSTGATGATSSEEDNIGWRSLSWSSVVAIDYFFFLKIDKK